MSENKFPGMPEIKFSKNGYEIRTDILGLANQLVLEEYRAKIAGWEMTGHKLETGQIVTTVTMPEFPGLERVLEIANQMYEFVNSGTRPKKNTSNK